MLTQVHLASKSVLLRAGLTAVLIGGGCLCWLMLHRTPVQTGGSVALRLGLAADDKITAYVDPSDFAKAMAMYADLTGRTALPSTLTPLQELDESLNGRLTRWRLLKPRVRVDPGISYHRDGRWSAGEIKDQLEALFASHGLRAVPSGNRAFLLVRVTP